MPSRHYHIKSAREREDQLQRMPDLWFDDACPTCGRHRAEKDAVIEKASDVEALQKSTL